MIGLVFFFVLLCSCVCYHMDMEKNRKGCYRDALSDRHLDYRDFYGRYWYGNTACELDIKDGHELLIDKKDNTKVYVDYTQQKYDKKYEYVNKLIKEDENAKKIAIKWLKPLVGSSFPNMCISVCDGKYYKSYVNSIAKTVLLVECKLIIKEDGTWKFEEVGERRLTGDEGKWYSGYESQEWRAKYIIDHNLRDVYGI